MTTNNQTSHFSKAIIATLTVLFLTGLGTATAGANGGADLDTYSTPVDCSNTQSYSTVSDVESALSSGENVVCVDGELNDRLNIDESNKVVLGASDSLQMINVSEAGNEVNRGVTITGENVTLSGFEVTGATNGTNAVRVDNAPDVTLTHLHVHNNSVKGVRVGGSSSGAVIEHVLVNNNYGLDEAVSEGPTFDDGTDGVTLYPGDNAEVKHVTIHDNGDNGLYLNGDNIVAKDIVTYNNGDQGIDISLDYNNAAGPVTVEDAHSYNNGAPGIEVEDNENQVKIKRALIEDNGQLSTDTDDYKYSVLLTDDNDDADANGNVVVERSSFNQKVGNKGEGSDYGKLNTMNNYWGTSDPDFTAMVEGPGEVEYSPWLAEEPGTNPQTYLVDDSGTIQDAVDAASSGDTVEVKEGTFAETVDIDVDNLTLEGQGISDSVINGSINIGQDQSSVSVNNTEISGFTINSKDGNFAVETTIEHTENITIEENRIVGEAGSGAAAYFTNPINIDIRNNEFAGPVGSGASETVGDLLGIGAAASDDGDNYSISGNSFESTIKRDQPNGGNAIEIRTNGTVEVEDNDFTNVNSTNGALIWASDKSTDVSIYQNEIVHKGGTGDGVTAQDGAGVDATYNYWGAASGPEGSGADVTGDVDFEPWLLESDGTEYDETIRVDGGDWSLVSAPKEIDVDASALKVDGGGTADQLVYDTKDGKFETLSGASEGNPLGAAFIRPDSDAGLGLVYTSSSDVSKKVHKGWNMISSTKDKKLRDALSPIGDSLNSFYAPDTYNERKGHGHTDFGENASEVLDASDRGYLQDQFSSGQKVSTYDGYWVKAYGQATLDMSVPQPE